MTDSLRLRAEERVERKIKFYKNLQAYIVVNAFLAVINWLFTPEFWWVAFPLFFWGLDVLDKFFKAYSIKDYREKMIQKEISRMGD